MKSSAVVKTPAKASLSPWRFQLSWTSKSARYKEVVEATGRERIEELADMLEIIIALAKLEQKTLDDVIEVSKQKVKKRGAFDKKIYLEKVL